MPISLLDLGARDCRFPLGHPDEAGFGFCGAPVAPGRVYCIDHCRIAYVDDSQRQHRMARGWALRAARS